MQGLVSCLSYVLEHMDLMMDFVDIVVEMVSVMRNLCGENCESVGHFLWNFPAYSEHYALFWSIKNMLGK